MIYEVYGGFELKRDAYRHGIYDNDFWAIVDKEAPDLSKACGCYVFALQNGSNIAPWYVGKAEFSSFKGEAFAPAKRLTYNDVLIRHNGAPLLFFIVRLTGSGGKFSKRTSTGYRDVDFLESMLIGMALERNPKLMNVKKTALLRDMKVPGVINSPQARPTKPVADLRNCLGLSNS